MWKIRQNAEIIKQKELDSLYNDVLNECKKTAAVNNINKDEQISL